MAERNNRKAERKELRSTEIEKRRESKDARCKVFERCQVECNCEQNKCTASGLKNVY